MKPQNHAIQRFPGMQLAREFYPEVERQVQRGIHLTRVVCFKERSVPRANREGSIQSQRGVPASKLPTLK